MRGLYLLHGAGRAAAVLAGLLILSFVIDWFLRPPLGVRVVHGLLSLAAFGWALHAFLVRPLRRPLSDEEVALAVEARVPSLQDRLVGALQWERILADPDCGESRAFMEASAAEAAVAVRAVRAGDLTDPRSARRSLLLGGSVAGALLLGAALSGDAAATWIRRSLLLLDEPWPRRTTLVVLGFDPDRPHVTTIGEDLPVQVRVEGVVPEGGPDEGVVLHYRTLEEGERRVERDARPMLQSAEDPRSFGFVFHEIPASFRFWVTGGDDDDGEPVYTVRALVPPAMEDVVADLAFPPETGMPPERRTEGDLEVPAGTAVSMTVRATVPLGSAALVHPEGAAERPLAVEADGRTVRFTAVVTESADWRLDMVAADGARSVPARNTRRFTALPDPRPDVRLLHPTSRLWCVADGRVPVKVRATDNYSLARVSLEVVPGRGREPLEVPLLAAAPPPGGGGPAPGGGVGGARPPPHPPRPPAAAGAGGAPGPPPRRGAPRGGGGPPPARVREIAVYRLLDLTAVSPPEGEKGVAPEDEILIRGVASDNAGAVASTDQVALQITDAGEILRRLTQRQSRIREDLEALRRHVEEAREAALRARDALAAGPLSPADRASIHGPAGLAARSVRESAALADALGDVLLTYGLNRLVENRVATERLVSVMDDWLREDREDPSVVFKPGLWRRLAAAHESREIDDRGILGSLLQATGLSDRLSTGPATALRTAMESLSGSTAADADPAAAAAAAVKSADEALVLVKEIGLHLQQWETMHEILEAVRAIQDQQEGITRGLRGGSPPGPR